MICDLAVPDIPMKRLTQFRLSTLLVAMLVMGSLCGYVSNHAAEFRNEQRSVDQLLSAFNMATSDSVNATTDGRTVVTKFVSGVF